MNNNIILQHKNNDRDHNRVLSSEPLDSRGLVCNYRIN